MIHTQISVLLLCFCLLISCEQQAQNSKLEKADPTPKSVSVVQEEEHSIIDPKGMDVESRVRVPVGYKRSEVENNSFGHYLRHLPLLPDGSPVLYYDGQTKARRVDVAVVDIDVGKRDLQQCADAVMRLRGEYLYSQKKYEQIHFNFTNGFRVDYSEWMKGKRMVVSGNKTYWRQQVSPSNTHADFRKYMDLIFTYAGTLSLSKELPKVSLDDLQIGDVFIEGGSPGHAVIVLDVAVHSENGEKIFLLAQSYMPAQSIHILMNPNASKLSPWYEVPEADYLQTPEWTFSPIHLKRFED